jgi:hypothetical protein
MAAAALTEAHNAAVRDVVEAYAVCPPPPLQQQQQEQLVVGAEEEVGESKTASPGTPATSSAAAAGTGAVMSDQQQSRPSSPSPLPSSGLPFVSAALLARLSHYWHVAVDSVFMPASGDPAYVRAIQEHARQRSATAQQHQQMQQQ